MTSNCSPISLPQIEFIQTEPQIRNHQRTMKKEKFRRREAYILMDKGVEEL